MSHQPQPEFLERREFLKLSVGAGLALWAAQTGVAAETDGAAETVTEPIIDIHQHTNYHGRTNTQLVAHQRAMGVTQSILLPAGRDVDRRSTNSGKYNGLGGVQAGGNESALAVARQLPGEFYFGANEVTDLPESVDEIAKYLDLGGIIIGEQKFVLDLDSPESQRLYALAAEHRVPILMHFQHGVYNQGYERLPAMLKKYPRTIFIGHAQTWWANIDKNHLDQSNLYPKGAVTPGGLTDRYLADFENLYADLSAGSGLNALTRDEEHARGFLERHQNKILYGSDCADTEGTGPKCQGAQTIAAVRRLSPTRAIERKILYENAKALFRLT